MEVQQEAKTKSKTDLFLRLAIIGGAFGVAAMFLYSYSSLNEAPQSSYVASVVENYSSGQNSSGQDPGGSDLQNQVYSNCLSQCGPSRASIYDFRMKTDSGNYEAKSGWYNGVCKSKGLSSDSCSGSASVNYAGKKYWCNSQMSYCGGSGQ